MVRIANKSAKIAINGLNSCHGECYDLKQPRHGVRLDVSHVTVSGGPFNFSMLLYYSIISFIEISQLFVCQNILLTLGLEGYKSENL